MLKNMKEIFGKFKFEISPVGVKFLNIKPQGLNQLGKIMDFCEMLKEAQNGNCFYVMKDISPVLVRSFLAL